MRKFLINVNGTKYEVEVEEIDAKAVKAAPAPESPKEAPKAEPKPKAKAPAIPLLRR